MAGHWTRRGLPWPGMTRNSRTCKPLVNHGVNHRRSTSRQKACVIAAVVLAGIGFAQLHSLNSPSHEQPPETSHLVFLIGTSSSALMWPRSRPNWPRGAFATHTEIRLTQDSVGRLGLETAIGCPVLIGFRPRATPRGRSPYRSIAGQFRTNGFV